ncbi:MAG: hypothetical protein ABI171_00895 [Collimonas sp.]|uniref:hypothetical protein n=1 Tax=Collimonas sp. TaxID=1963772 RepID=UPI00326482C7
MHQQFLNARSAVLLALLAALAWLIILLNLLPPLAAHGKPHAHMAPIFTPH